MTSVLKALGTFDEFLIPTNSENFRPADKVPVENHFNKSTNTSNIKDFSETNNKKDEGFYIKRLLLNIKGLENYKIHLNFSNLVKQVNIKI